MKTLRAAMLLSVCGLAGLVPMGCESTPGGVRESRLLDGAVTEWNSGAVAEADADWMYLRFSVDGEPSAIQSSTESLSIWLDIDGNASTGRKNPAKAFAGLGVDLEVQFSPRNEQTGKLGGGIAVTGFKADGTPVPLAWKDVLFTASPTYASRWYEARLSRHADFAAWGLPAASGLAASGTVRGTFVLQDAPGKIVGFADEFTATVPARSAARPLADVNVPAKPQGAIRVMNWNVLWSSPESKPAEFSRILKLLNPDVILLQEWDKNDAAGLDTWFTMHVDPEQDWHAVKMDGGERPRDAGVAIVSRWPLEHIGPTTISTIESDGREHAIRAITALIRPDADNSHGGIALTSLHLKCCGGANSREDQQRMAEARAINNAMSMALDGAPATIRIIAGDFNLVGTRPPLDLARADLDFDGSDLTVAEPRLLGDSLLTTWWDEESSFSPGRLDYMVYSDSTADVVNAFVFDTWKFTDASLARMGLDRSDSSASDHLPVVVDLKPR